MHEGRGFSLPSEKPNPLSKCEQSAYERDEIVLLPPALNPPLIGVAQRRPRSRDRRQVFAHPGKIFAPLPLSEASTLGIPTPPLP